jgi:hypothetical protein
MKFPISRIIFLSLVAFASCYQYIATNNFAWLVLFITCLGFELTMYEVNKIKERLRWTNGI